MTSEFGLSTITLRGEVISGQSWATLHGNWPRMCRAHEDELSDIWEYFEGTLNIALTDPRTWSPPRDDELRTKAREKGLQFGNDNDRGADFLRFGNYIHPDLEVTTIDGISVSGRVYYAGSLRGFTDDGRPLPIVRDRVEILSRDHLRDRLDMKDTNSRYPVSVVIKLA